MHLKWLMIAGLICLISCKQENKKSATYQNIEEEIPDDFLPFYQRFHEDTVFQMESIVFPLEGDPAIDSIEIQDFYWRKSDWVWHKTFDDDGTFKRTFTAMQSIVVENIVDNSGRYDMIRRWSKIGGEWHLIYYKTMGHRR